jgi:xanthine dehydrogenase small subunit
MRDYLHFFVNGKECRVRGSDAFQPLSSFLRNNLGITGTKVVCEEGDCGACTTLSGRLKAGTIEYKPINSCIQYVYQADCSHIITVEGLKDRSELTAVQESMVDCHGAQCGFCTPGIILALSDYFDKNKQASPQGLKDSLTGNLCRCTGYDPIIKAGMNVNTKSLVPVCRLYPPESLAASLQPALKESAQVSSHGQTVFIPATCEELVSFKKANPQAVILSGGTDVCVNMNKRGYSPEALISLANLPGLDNISVSDGIMIVGARVTLSQMEDYCRTRIPEFYNLLTLFGSPQIRNAATLAGNVANASPIGDTPPFLFVMDAVLELVSSSGTRQVRLNEFYRGYKKFDLAADEFISSIAIPLPTPGEIIKLYKVSRRKHLDIATNTAAFRLKLKGDRLAEIAIAYGGVAPVILRLPKTEAFLKGKALTPAIMEEAGEIAVGEISPIDDVRGSKAFRNQLARNLMLKLYYDIQEGRVAVCQP